MRLSKRLYNELSRLKDGEYMLLVESRNRRKWRDLDRNDIHSRFRVVNINDGKVACKFKIFGLGCLIELKYFSNSCFYNRNLTLKGIVEEMIYYDQQYKLQLIDIIDITKRK